MVSVTSVRALFDGWRSRGNSLSLQVAIAVLSPWRVFEGASGSFVGVVTFHVVLVHAAVWAPDLVW